MKKPNNFTKSLILHIRYPWTAATLLILWLGVAMMCMLMKVSSQDIIILTSVTGAATLIIALIGFRK